MKIYIAGPLCEEKNRNFLEKIERLCKEIGFETFLPHRDAGLYDGNKNKIKEISRKDVEELYKCSILIGVLNGVCVGAGTSWEMGYAQALGKKVIGLKTDRNPKESIGDISVVIAGQVEILENLEDLKEKLLSLKS